jgi:hypothetical protein
MMNPTQIQILMIFEPPANLDVGQKIDGAVQDIRFSVFTKIWAVFEPLGTIAAALLLVETMSVAVVSRTFEIEFLVKKNLTLSYSV